MTKAQIVDRIATATGLTKMETEAVVDGFMLTLIEAVEAGELVELRGFGTFRARLRKARKARNPKTDEPVEVPRQYVPVFKPAAEFRRTVNEARQSEEQHAEAQHARSSPSAPSL